MSSLTVASQTCTACQRLEWSAIGRFVREHAEQLASEHWQSLIMAVGCHRGNVGEDPVGSAQPEAR